MSQEKVNARKEYKKNRKQIIAKEKRQQKFGKFIAYVIAIVVIGGVGFSVYKKVNPTPEQDASSFYSLIQTDEYGILHPSVSE